MGPSLFGFLLSVRVHSQTYVLDGLIPETCLTPNLRFVMTSQQGIYKRNERFRLYVTFYDIIMLYETTPSLVYRNEVKQSRVYSVQSSK